MDIKKIKDQPMWTCPVKPLALNDNIEPEWEVTITKVQNGYMMSYKENISENEDKRIFKIEREVFENDNDKEFISNWDEVDKSQIDAEDIAMHNLLYAIKGHFGHYHNKHQKVNLVIKFEKENYED